MPSELNDAMLIILVYGKRDMAAVKLPQPELMTWC